jgi:hypothetical protein
MPVADCGEPGWLSRCPHRRGRFESIRENVSKALIEVEKKFEELTRKLEKG